MSVRVKIIRFLINLIENIFFYPKLKRVYETLNTKNDLTIIDVGTNRGQTIDFFSKNFKIKTLVGFEPNQTLFNLLVKKYQHYSNIKIINCGVSSQNKKITFYENILDETSTFEKINIDSKYALRKAKILGTTTEKLTSNKYYVECMTLSKFFTENSYNYIDILKIDVEGHEYEVLKGLFSSSLTTKINYIQLESHNDDLYTHKNHEIHEILLLNNFNLCESVKHSFGDFKELVYINNLYNLH